MKKRSLLMAASLVLALLVATTGTLAYLSDVDSDVNVMTLGNVQIEQIELQRAEGVAHNATAAEGDLVPFVNGQPLYPAYPVNGEVTDYSAEATDLFKWGPYVHTGTAANGLWNDEKLKGAMDKMVFVKNTGASDAYFRTWIAYECPEGIIIGEPSDGAHIMINKNGSSIYTEEVVGTVEIEGTTYAVLCYTYQKALQPGQMSHPSLLQVVMTHHATNTEMELLGPTYEILAYTQAVQVTNFPDATTALTAAFGEVKLDNIPWLTDTTGLPVTVVATADELTAALAEGGTILLTADIDMGETAVTVPAGTEVTLDLGGKTLSVKNTEAKASCAIDNKGSLTIANGTVTYEGMPDPAFGYGTNTITNSGNLVIDGATIINNTDGGSSNAIDNAPGSTLVVNSGVLEAKKITIRVRDNATVTINGGEITGNRAMQIHLFQKVNAPTTVTINGGTFTSTDSTYNMALYSTAGSGSTFAKTTVTITGGVFNGNVCFGGGDKTAQETVSITGGTFNASVGRYLANDGWEDIAKP